MRQIKGSPQGNNSQRAFDFCHLIQFCAIIIPIPPATTNMPIVKKNQKNHWA